MNKKSVNRWLVRQKPARRWLFISIALGIFSGVLIIIQSHLIAVIVDRVYLYHATRTLLSSALTFFIAVVLFRATVTWLREIISFQTARCVKESVRKNITEVLLQYTPHELSRHKTGALTSVMIEQVEALHGFFADYLPQMTIAVFLPLIILGVVFTQNWLAGLVLLITAPLIPLFMALIGIHAAKLNQDNFQLLSRMSAHFLDMLQGLATLSLFNRARAQSASIHAVSDAFRENTMRILRVAFLSTATLELFSTISIAIIAVYLGLGLLGFLNVGFEGVHITLAHALFILLLAPEFFMPLRQLGTFYHARAAAMGAADEIIKLIDSKPAQSPVSQYNDRVIPESSALIFDRVDFTYGHTKILDQFSFAVSFGSCVALIGDSGSGKTTVMNLIAKFLTPIAGVIKIGDGDIAAIDNDQWRNHIAFLHQQPRLFHGTIFENIQFANPDASVESVELAALKAGVMEFASQLPDGLQTKIGEQNVGLSGGQAQRVALARIILKDAPIILLDEPTAHLDEQNWQLIAALLKQWHGHKTVVIASHDKRVIAAADEVITITG